MVSKDRLKGIRLFSGFSDEDLERAFAAAREWARTNPE